MIQNCKNGCWTKLATLILTSFPLAAGPIAVGPIYMSGSGTFEWSVFRGPAFSFAASGSDGVHTVSMSVIDGQDIASGGGSLPPAILAPLGGPPLGGCFNANGTIDAVSVTHNPCFAQPFTVIKYNLGLGGGFMDLFDLPNSGLVLLAHADLIASIQVTSYQEFHDGARLIGTKATFDIVSTPEPATWMLTTLGLTALVSWQLRPKRHQIHHILGQAQRGLTWIAG